MNTHKKKILTFLSVSLLSFMIGVDLLGAGIALPSISYEFSVRFSYLQWFLTAFAMGTSSFLVTSGKITDLYGARNTFAIGTTLFIVSSICIALTPHFYIICIERFIQGAAGAIMATASVSIISNNFSEKERLHYLAGLIAAGGLGMALGPIIGGYLIEIVNWQLIFWINMPIGIIALIIGVVLQKPGKRTQSQSFDYIGVIIFILTICMLTIVLNNGSIWGWTSFLTFISSFITFCLFIFFIKYESYCKNPLLHLDLFKVKNFIPSNILGFTLYFGLISWIFNFNIYYEYIELFTPVQTGLHFFPMAIFVLLGGFLMKKIILIFSSIKSLILFAVVLNIIAFGLLTIISLDKKVLTLLVFVIIGIGFVILNANTINIGIKYFSKERIGLASGTSLMIRWLGGAMGGAISGSIMHIVPSYYLSKHFTQIPSSDIQQIKDMMKSGIISLKNIDHSATKEIIKASLANSVHVNMSIVFIFFIINFFYIITSIKE